MAKFVGFDCKIIENSPVFRFWFDDGLARKVTAQEVLAALAKLIDWDAILNESLRSDT